MSTIQFANYPGPSVNQESFPYPQSVNIGNIIKISGQGGWDTNGTSPDINIKTAAAFGNVEQALKTMNTRLSLKDVYAVRSYHTNIAETFGPMSSHFMRLVPGHRPIWICVEVARLQNPGMAITI